jgi:hypothetical protein
MWVSEEENARLEQAAALYGVSVSRFQWRGHSRPLTKKVILKQTHDLQNR